MIEFDDKVVNEKFQKLPFETQRILASTKIVEDIQSIGNNNGLLLDQISILFNLVTYILLGLIPAKDFVKILSEEAELDEITSREVAEDINDKVLADIRGSMQGIRADQDDNRNKLGNNVKTLEQAGGFTIEKSPGPNGNGGNDGNGNENINGGSDSGNGNDNNTNYNDSHYTNGANVTFADKDKILNDIENPPHAREKIIQNTTKESSPETHIEPLVDQLLATPVASPEPESTTKPPKIDRPPPMEIPKPPPKPKGSDPYRELIT